MKYKLFVIMADSDGSVDIPEGSIVVNYNASPLSVVILKPVT